MAKPTFEIPQILRNVGFVRQFRALPGGLG